MEQALTCSVVGSTDTVKRGFETFIDRTGTNEIMVAAQIFDHAARLHSFEIAARVHGKLSEAA